MDGSSGYVTEAPYVIRLHRALNPRRMNLALLANGIAAPSPDAPYTYMELGFGQGVSLAMLAAANPHAQFYGVDFLAEHVAHAKGLADAAGINNLHLRQLSFSDLRNYEWPDFDYVAMHGVWTWVAKAYRDDILTFIDARLKPGGVVYVSYNAMPGWAAMEPVRAVMKMEYERASGSLEQRIKTALRQIRQMEKAQPLYFRDNPSIDLRLKQMESEPAAYVAHEYFNAEWKPFYFEDVAADFGKLGLSFAASANLQDNVVDIAVRPEAKALYGEMKTALQRETLKDLLSNKQFRRDLYVRDMRVLADTELEAGFAAALFATQMSLTELAEAKLSTESASMKLNTPVHRALVAALGADGPQTAARLGANPAVNLSANAAYGTLFLLAAMNAVEAAAPDSAIQNAQESCRKLNAAIMARAATAHTVPAMVAPVVGAGVEVSAYDQLFLLAAAQKAEPIAFAAEAIKKNDHVPKHDGKPVQPGDISAFLRQKCAEFSASRQPILAQLGIAS